MSDPTELVITLTFGLALALFVAGSAIRWACRFRAAVNSDGPGPPPAPFGRVPVWFYRPVDLLGAGFVFFVYAGLVIASLRLAGEEAAELSPSALLANIASQFILAGIVTLTVLWRVHPVEWLGLRWARWPWAFVIGPVGVVSMWFLFGTLDAAGFTDWIESLGAEPTQDSVKLLQESKDPLALGLMAFAAVIAAPLCEEVLFRGYLYPVTKRFAGPWIAGICSALVFGAAHGSLSSTILLFIFGLLMVAIYEKTGSLWACISVHFFFNAATVAIQMTARHYDIPLEPAS